MAKSALWLPTQKETKMLRLNDQELSDLIAKLEAERVPDPKNDQEFLNLILKVDDELYEEGLLDPKKRAWELYIRVMTKLGHASVSMGGPEQRRFNEILKKNAVSAQRPCRWRITRWSLHVSRYCNDNTHTYDLWFSKNKPLRTQ